MRKIEESAHECALEVYDYLTRNSCTKDEIVDAIQSAYLQGSGHLMSLPIEQRLTAEEQEMIRFAYGASKKLSDATANPNIVEVFKGQYLLLESIFGKSMFAEEGGEK